MNDACLSCEFRSDKLTFRVLRLINGFSLKYVSWKIEISPDTLSKYEKNPELMPSGIAVKLANLYNVPVDDIVFK